MGFRTINKDRRRRLVLNRVLKGSLNASCFILLTIAELGEIAMEAFHPKRYAFTALGRDLLGLNSEETKWSRRTLNDKMGCLIKEGLVVKDTKDKNYRLTSIGQKLADEANDYFSSVNRKWDGIFRAVIFDIPERRKEYRNWLRSNLYFLGFKQLQESVFIGKNALPASFVKEISYLKLDDCVHILSIREIDNKKEIAANFGDD